jgi:two-component system response regulator FixJ
MNMILNNSIPIPEVYIIDDNEAVRDALNMLLYSMSIKNSTYVNGQAFIDTYKDGKLKTLTGCIVLDISKPTLSGLECQCKLLKQHCSLPIIFITGHGDVQMAIEAMKRGAIEFIQKPFREQQLLDSIQSALKVSEQGQSQLRTAQQIEVRLKSLTKRERHVMQKVIYGQANKVIAAELNLSQRTIEIHRDNMMEKMQAKSLAELVRMVLTQEYRAQKRLQIFVTLYECRNIQWYKMIQFILIIGLLANISLVTRTIPS